MNPASWIILSVIIAIVFIAIAYIVKHKGKTCSCCNKDSCPMKKMANNTKNIDINR